MNFIDKIRLSNWFIIVFIVYLSIALSVPGIKLDSAVLTLFSVNSFLYGFYVSPIINYQKSRIDELHKLVRQETNALFEVAINLKGLKPKDKEEYKDLLSKYIGHMSSKKYSKAEDEYEALITKSLDNGDDNITAKLVSNQQNRTMINMWLNAKVYSNEWIVILILFSVTTGLILAMEKPNNVLVSVITGAICSGLTLLMISLYKYSNLTHKKAKTIWDSALKLKSSRYYKTFSS
jgi:hypothetical protein